MSQTNEGFVDDSETKDDNEVIQDLAIPAEKNLADVSSPEDAENAGLVPLNPEEKWRIIKNAVVLSLAFMVHFTAFQGAVNLQSTINIEDGLGTASLASIYASLILSNLFLPVVMINFLGVKWTTAISFIAYMPYIAAQFYPTFYTMIPAGIFVGLGGGPLWCAKCTYLTVIASPYEKLTGVPSEVLVVRFFGVFFMIFQFSQVWGNLISSLVLSGSLLCWIMALARRVEISQ